MHATYSFLVSLKELRESHGTPETTDKELVQSAVERFEHWADKRCDENNWSQPMALVTSKGEIFSTCPEDEFAEDFAKDKDGKVLAGKELWEHATRFALSCLAFDLELYDACPLSIGQEDAGQKKIDDLDIPGLISEIKKQIPARLSQQYATYKPAETDRFDMASYKRQKTARQFEFFNISLAAVPGFSDEGNPYEFRNFDIRNDSRGCSATDEQELAILFVNIHT